MNLDIQKRNLSRTLKAFRQTVMVFLIMAFWVLVGMSLGFVLETPFNNFMAAGIFFIILMYFNYRMNDKDVTCNAKETQTKT